MATSSAVKVFVRIRNDGVMTRTLSVKSNEIQILRKLVNEKTFHFENVFPSDSSQHDVYIQAVFPYVKDALEGYNCTIFVYGQTGTGKTFTMEGIFSHEMTTMSDNGIIPRACWDILSHLNSHQCLCYNCQISYFEIYNEEVIDLLDENNVTNAKLKVFENKIGSSFIQNLTKVQIRSYSDLLQHLVYGKNKRQTLCTKLNKQSSRSHAIFVVETSFLDCKTRLWKNGKINFVDLAGSENASRSGVAKKHLQETSNINKSLLTLGRVINALSERNKHVPFRESNLTRILKDSISGNTKTAMIATISSVASNEEETIKTLQYAANAALIVNTIQANVVLEKVNDPKDDYLSYNTSLWGEIIEKLEPKLAQYNIKSDFAALNKKIRLFQVQFFKLEKENCIEDSKDVEEMVMKKVIKINTENEKDRNVIAKLKTITNQWQQKIDVQYDIIATNYNKMKRSTKTEVNSSIGKVNQLFYQLFDFGNSKELKELNQKLDQNNELMKKQNQLLNETKELQNLVTNVISTCLTLKSKFYDFKKDVEQNREEFTTAWNRCNETITNKSKALKEAENIISTVSNNNFEEEKISFLNDFNDIKEEIEDLKRISDFNTWKSAFHFDDDLDND